AMERIINNGGQLSSSETVAKVTEEYFVESDSILTFIHQCGIDENMTTKGVYDEYLKTCEESGSKPYTQTKFTQRLKSLGYDKAQRRMMGKKYYYYKFNEIE
ncbi:primase-like DNA-binding domain-containing protein, partial [Enterococcus faecalis]